jgi:hypothetical protein
VAEGGLGASREWCPPTRALSNDVNLQKLLCVVNRLPEHVVSVKLSVDVGPWPAAADETLRRATLARLR